MIVPMVLEFSFLGAGEIVGATVESLGDKGRFLHLALEVGVHGRSSISSALHLRQKLDKVIINADIRVLNFWYSTDIQAKRIARSDTDPVRAPHLKYGERELLFDANWIKGFRGLQAFMWHPNRINQVLDSKATRSVLGESSSMNVLKDIHISIWYLDCLNSENACPSLTTELRNNKYALGRLGKVAGCHWDGMLGSKQKQRVGGKKVLSKNMFSCQEQTLTTLKAQIYFPKTMQKQQDLIKILERSMPLWKWHKAVKLSTMLTHHQNGVYKLCPYHSGQILKGVKCPNTNMENLVCMVVT